MNFADVKAITIPEGVVNKITAAGKVIWEKVTAPTYTNVLPLAIDTDGTPYNGGLGYKTGWRINSSNVEKESAYHCLTGYIPVKLGDVIRLKNVALSIPGSGYVVGYDSSFASGHGLIYESKLTDAGNGVFTITVSTASGFSTAVAYVRFSIGTIDSTSIITINEEIA